MGEKKQGYDAVVVPVQGCVPVQDYVREKLSKHNDEGGDSPSQQKPGQKLYANNNIQLLHISSELLQTPEFWPCLCQDSYENSS